jgi:AmmeMemoRadiSam system protein B
MATAVRRAAVAGSWYPGTSSRIVEEIEGYLDGVPPIALEGRVVGLVSPHAGLRYSGPVAAYGYSLLRERDVGTVVLIGPSHHEGFDGMSVFASGAWESPLGRSPIDADLADLLIRADPRIADVPGPHIPEHSLEMQLPFLQHLVPNLKLVPILMGVQSRRNVDCLASALARALAERPSLLVASSDLSHFNPAGIANELDAQVVADIERFDAAGLMSRLESSPDHACGGGPIVAVMKASRALGAERAEVLRYADSGDVGERDKSRVVGYVSAALVAPA